MGSIYIVNYLYNWNRYKIFKNTRTWIKYSVEVSYLISKAIDSNEEKNKFNEIESFLKAIVKKEHYIFELLRQIYSDMDFNNLSDPKKYKTLNEDDILREIILKEFKKYQNQTRYNILENYFTNTLPTLKYKNKHRIINAVKNINDEMEEAQKEFSKLFKVDSYENNR